MIMIVVRIEEGQGRNEKGQDNHEVSRSEQKRERERENDMFYSRMTMIPLESSMNTVLLSSQK